MAVGSCPYPIVKVIRIWCACKRTPCVSEVVKRAVAAESERKCFLYHGEGARKAMEFWNCPIITKQTAPYCWWPPEKRKPTLFSSKEKRRVCRSAFGNFFCI